MREVVRDVRKRDDHEDYDPRDYEHDYVWRQWARVRCIRRSACHILEIYDLRSYLSIANEIDVYGRILH